MSLTSTRPQCMDCNKERKVDRLIHWLIVAQVVLGIAIMASIVFARCSSAQPAEGYDINQMREQHKELQLRTLEDSVSYFEDGF